MFSMKNEGIERKIQNIMREGDSTQEKKSVDITTRYWNNAARDRQTDRLS